MGLPAWLFAPLPSVLYLLHVDRRRKRKNLGLPVKCSYNLRGLNDWCPEYGELTHNRKVLPHGQSA